MNELNNQSFEQWLSTPLQKIKDDGFSEQVLKKYQQYYLKRKVGLMIFIGCLSLIFISLFSFSSLFDSIGSQLVQLWQLIPMDEMSDAFSYRYSILHGTHGVVELLKQPIWTMLFISVFVVGLLIKTSDNL